MTAAISATMYLQIHGKTAGKNKYTLITVLIAGIGTRTVRRQ